jgi:pentatricopeptide repeat protein
MGDVETIKTTIREMTLRKIKPDEYTFSAYLHGLANELKTKPSLVTQNLESAQILFDEMKQRGVEYRLTTVNNFLTVYTYGKVLNRAETFFRSKYTEMGFVADEHSYTNMIYMYAQAKRPDAALKMLREMEDKNLKPTYGGYREIIFSYISMGRYPMGHILMTEMFTKYKFMFAPHDLVAYKRLTTSTKNKRAQLRQASTMTDKMSELL